MICPPVDATASTAAANGGRKPVRFISGIVIGPSTITLATALPDTVPNRLDDTTATLPGPPAWMPGDRHREVHEQLAGAALLHERTEQHEQHHVARRHAERRAEDALGGQVQLLHQHRRGHPREAERVDQERDRGQRQREPDHPPRRLEHDHHRVHRVERVRPRQVVDVDDAVDEVVVLEKDVQDEAEAQRQQQQVERAPRRPPGARRVQQEDQRQREQRCVPRKMIASGGPNAATYM